MQVKGDVIKCIVIDPEGYQDIYRLYEEYLGVDENEKFCFRYSLLETKIDEDQESEETIFYFNYLPKTKALAVMEKAVSIAETEGLEVMIYDEDVQRRKNHKKYTTLSGEEKDIVLKDFTFYDDSGRHLYGAFFETREEAQEYAKALETEYKTPFYFRENTKETD